MQNVKKWIVFVLVVLCYGLPNYAGFVIAGRALEVIETLGISTSQFSALSTAPMLIGVFFSLILGLLMDRFKAKYVMGVAVAVSAISAVCRVYAVSFFPLWFFSVFLGMSATAGNACTPKILSQWFSRKSIDRACGAAAAFSSCILGLGTATGGMYKSLFAAFAWSALFLCVACVLWFLLVPRDNPDPAFAGAAVPAGEREASAKFTECLSVVVRSKALWAVAVAWLFQVGSCTGISVFLAALLNSIGLGTISAGLTASTFTYGTAAGALIGPLLFTAFGVHKKKWLVFCGLAAGLLTAWGWRMGGSGVLLAAIMAVDGFLAGNMMAFFFSAAVMLPGIGPRYAGTAGGLLSTLTLIASVALPTYVYAPIAGDNYSLLFVLFGGGLILSGLFTVLVPVAEMGREAEAAVSHV